MADRFLFSPGLFLLIAVVYLILPYLKSKKINQALLIILMIISILAFSYIQVRNKDWNNNDALYFKDVKVASNSVRALAFCGMNLVSESDTIPDSLRRVNSLRQAILYFEKAYSIYTDFTTMYQNWGGAYYRLNNIDSAVWAWSQLKKLKPDSRFNALNDDLISKYKYNFYHQLFLKEREKNNKETMLLYYRQAVFSYDKMADAWSLLGQLYFINGMKDSALYAWNRCLFLDSTHAQARQFLKEAGY
jgi:hypothetical protein